MKRHIIDRSQPRDEALRARHFAEIERRSGEPVWSSRIRALYRQPRLDAAGRNSAYLRIERGYKA